MVDKVLYDFDGDKYYIESAKKDFHLKFGQIDSKQLMAASGDKNKVTSNQNKVFFALDAGFMDNFEKIKRGAQIILPKDAAVIMAYCGITDDSIVLDAGAGSGGMACFLAKHAKKVISYDIAEDNIALAKKNAEYLGIKNAEFKKGDLYEGVAEKNFDAATIDVTEPWKALPTLAKAVKMGGFIAVYCPSITQNQQFVNEARDFGILPLTTFELTEREWNVNEKRARPKSGTIYTGFITIARKIALPKKE